MRLCHKNQNEKLKQNRTIPGAKKPLRKGGGFFGIFLIVLSLPAACLFVSSSCSFQVLKGGEITICSYNVQNLFDDRFDGTEYDDFNPENGSWGSRHYEAKLRRTAEAIEKAVPGGADILLLQEVENRSAAERLTGEYLQGLGYESILAPSGEGAAVNTVIVSKFPVTRVLSHRVQLPVEGSDRLRLILEAVVETDVGKIRVFNNHWKSKSGGAEATEPLRLAAADLITDRLKILKEEDDLPFVIGGDLNGSFDDWGKVPYPTALMPGETGNPGAAGGNFTPLAAFKDPDKALLSDVFPVLYNPWDSQDFHGSYAYRGEWERIDYLLVSPCLVDGMGLEFDSFRVVSRQFLLNDGGFPARWNPADLTGYSDHLPLVLTLRDGDG